MSAPNYAWDYGAGRRWPKHPPWCAQHQTDPEPSGLDNLLGFRVGPRLRADAEGVALAAKRLEEGA